jgi:hypothetical protein
MDSYNRGYGEGIFGLPVILNQTKIGDATIIRQSDVTAGAAGVNAGFYAIAYQLNGQKIISYRGTNFELEGGRESELAKDAFNGWTLGAGFSSAAQAQQAYPARPLPLPVPVVNEPLAGPA